MGVVKPRRRASGTMEEQRVRHLQRQARQDALNRLKAGETVSIMAYTDEGYKRFTARPGGPNECLDGQTVLTLREGKIWAAFYYMKDGRAVHVSGDRREHAGKIFGVVVPDATEGVAQ